MIMFKFQTPIFFRCRSMRGDTNAVLEVWGLQSPAHRGGGVPIVVDACRYITIDPRTPPNAGTEKRRVFPQQADISCTKRDVP